VETKDVRIRPGSLGGPGRAKRSTSVRRRSASTLASSMPVTTTSHRPAPSPRGQLSAALAGKEHAGSARARVVDGSDGAHGPEPVGEQADLWVGDEVLRFLWGQPWELGTAAYWAEQTRRRAPVTSYALGDNLAEEVAACLLGGYGVPAAVGLAAFRATRDAGLLDGVPSAAALEALLRTPLHVAGRPRSVRYRFAAQRAHRLADALATLHASEPPNEPLQLRDWLLRLPGVGPKTASWIVRNHCGCQHVAIVDVHVHRAGLTAGFFDADWRLPRDYGRFELAFCEVAWLAGVSAAALDACIWDQLQALGPAAALLLGR